MESLGRALGEMRHSPPPNTYCSLLKRAAVPARSRSTSAMLCKLMAIISFAVVAAEPPVGEVFAEPSKALQLLLA